VWLFYADNNKNVNFYIYIQSGILLHMKTIFKNPFINSILAEAYIVFIVWIMHFFAKPNTPDTFYDSIAALSIFTLSAAIMGFLFLGEPLQLYLNGQKKEAVSFFLKTVLGFAVTTAVAILALQASK